MGERGTKQAWRKTGFEGWPVIVIPFGITLAVLAVAGLYSLLTP
jgi:hypothetical protein